VDEECLLRGTNLRFMMYYLREFQTSEEQKYLIVLSVVHVCSPCALPGTDTGTVYGTNIRALSVAAEP